MIGSGRSLFALALLLPCGACKPSPEALEFATPPPTVIYQAEPTALPALVVRDSDGNPMTPAPAIEWQARPTTVLSVQDGKVTPITNGEGEVSATVKDTSVTLTHKLAVRLVDKLELTCVAAECAYDLGGQVTVTVKASSGAEPVEGVPITWTVSPPTALESLGEGRFKALQAGKATIIAAAGSMSAKQVVTVSAPPDTLTLKCPANFVLKRGEATSCGVRQGKRVELEYAVLGQGQPARAPRLEWSTSDEGIASIASGAVQGVAAGHVQVKAALATLTATLAVDVLMECSGKWEAANLSFDAKVDGKKKHFDRSGWCQVRNPRSCLADETTAAGGLTAVAMENCCCTFDKPGK